jgi:aldose 1-epimerase
MACRGEAGAVGAGRLTALELAQGDAHVALAPAIGGAVASFTFGGAHVLRPMPGEDIELGNVRAAAAYPLVPYSNRIRDARLRFAGVDHPLTRNFGEHPHAIHGVGWQRAWDVVHVGAASAMLALTHDARGDGAGAWPWPFSATQSLTLAGDAFRATLALTLTVRNDGMSAFPFGLGWHPFFAKARDTELALRAGGVWRNDATQLPVAHERVPAAWNFAESRVVGDVGLDNVFTGWDGHAVLRTPSRQIAVTLDADSACRYAVVYAPVARGFVAVEPVTHETDAFNRDAAGERGTGTRVLPPGAAFSCTMRISAARIPPA